MSRSRRICNGHFHQLVVCLLLLVLGSPVVSGANVFENAEKEREVFKKAWRMVNQGQLSKAAPLTSSLEGYPLHVYLKAAQLRPTLQRRNNQELITFLDENEGAYAAEKLRTQRLQWLADTNQWQDYLDLYRPRTDVALQCHHKTALLETGVTEGLFQQILPLWSKGKSQPGACNRAFEYFESQPSFDDPIIWQRFRQAISNLEVGLARHLSKKFKKPEAALWAKRWIRAHNTPHPVLSEKYLTEENLLSREVMFHALKRLAKSNFKVAEKHWTRISGAQTLSDMELNQGNAILAIAAAVKEHKNQIFYLDQIENRYANAEIEELRVRRGVQLRAWEQLSRWTLDPPTSTKTNALRWRFWRARSAEILGRHDFAKQEFMVLSKERDYYGFVAADKAGLQYQFNDVPIKPSSEKLHAVVDRLGIQRAKEFFLLGFHTEANREWRYTLKDFTKSELEIAALSASQWGWHNRAIATLGQARSYDDVTVRFPVMFEKEIASNGQKRQLEEALIYSIVRTESAFLSSARSSAGALGLMQLMPATGREAGKRIGIKVKNSSQLLAPSVNISIGSSYLSTLMRKHGGSFPMAAAAYNAGPHRVRQWRPIGECVAADIWIDSIPFRETRRYVRTAMFYYVIYQYRLGLEIRPLKEMLQAISPSGGTQSC